MGSRYPRIVEIPWSCGHLAPRAELRHSGPRLDLAPEGVDAGVPSVRYLLKGLMGLLEHDLELRAGDPLRDGAAKLRTSSRVAAAAEDERRCGDPRQSVGRVVVEEGVYVPVKVRGSLLVREGEDLIDELGDCPVVVRPRGLDVQENPSRKARSLGATSTSQRTKRSHARR